MCQIVVLVLATAAVLTSASDDIIGPVPSGCLLPEYPEYGTYNVSGLPGTRPGQILENALLRYKCIDGFGIYGTNEIFCVGGAWSEPFPTCVRFCKLEQDPSLEFKCGTPDGNQRNCFEYEPVGEKVQVQCRQPIFTSVEYLPNMICQENGSWNYIAKCMPECGTLPNSGRELREINEKVKLLPWAAAVYSKLTKPYMYICGGTLVSATAVISAASCFTRGDQIQPKENYAVALGKKFSTWTNNFDLDAQKSDIKDIHITAQYTGHSTNYQANLAVVVLQTAVVFKFNIRPACLDFDVAFQRNQLSSGNIGTVGGWGQTANGELSQVMKVVEIPYVDVSDCIQSVPPNFRALISSDTFCAGSSNETRLGKGDSGSGLLFPSVDKGIERYYLRGIVSTKLFSEDSVAGLVAFTNIGNHKHFIQEYL